MKTDDKVINTIFLIGIALGFWIGIFVPHEVQNDIRTVLSLAVFAVASFGAAFIFLRGIVMLAIRGLRWAKWIPLLLLALPLRAAEVTLEWDANAPAEEITAYTVYEQIDGAWQFAAEVAADVLQVTLTVPAGAHTFALTATNQWGESDRGDPVTTPPLPSKPKGGKVKSVRIALQMSRDLEAWEPVLFAEVPTESRQFFRTVFE